MLPAFARYFPRPLLGSLLLLNLVTGTCLQAQEFGPASPKPEPTPLALLPAGQHIGLRYNTPSASSLAAVDSLWNRCHEAGLSAMPLSLAWADLESEAGVIDTAQLEVLLQLVQIAGLRPYLVLATIDGLALGVPADLSDPTDRRRLAQGKRWSDPALAQRFGTLLERVVPMLVEYGGFYLSIGHNVDARLFSSAAETKAYASFLRSARQNAKRLNPKLDLGTTISWKGLRRHPERFQELLAACDNVALTYYPLKTDFTPEVPEQVASHIAAMLKAVAPRPLLLQEFGYPSGNPELSGLGSSEAAQRSFIANCFDAFQAHPRIRFASYTGVVDLGPADLGILQLHHNSSDFNFVEFLGSVGLADHKTGQPKSAYAAFLRGLKALRQESLTQR